MSAGKIRTMGTVGELLKKREQVNLTAPRLKDTTVEKIRRLIEAEEGTGAGTVTVDHPMERLENFFLQVVEEASKTETDISGAMFGDMSTSRVFGGPTKPREDKSREQILGELTAAEPAATDTPPETPQAEAKTVERGVLDKLAGKAEAETEPKPADSSAPDTQAPPTEAPEPRVRRDLLDKLTDKSDDDQERSD